MKKKIISLFLAVTMACTVLTGCGKNNESAKTNVNNEKPKVEQNAPKEGGTFVVSITKAPESFNPNAKVNDLAKPVLHNVFNQLVKINGNDQVVPDLAKSWDFSDDGKTITFHLQSNVKWHDGKDFSSEDVKWTFDEIIAKKGLASESLASVEEITCPDKDTVVFKLKEADVSMISALAWNGTFIMPMHIYKDTDWLTNEANNKPIGTGAFKFVEYKDKQTITLEKNKDFWGEKVYLDKVVFTVNEDDNTAYQSWKNGELDELDNSVEPSEIEKLKSDKNYTVYNKLWPNRQYVLFNVKEGPFKDLKVRQAVELSIDRDEVFKKGFKGVGLKAEYFISPLYKWALDENVKIKGRDVEKAKKLLDEAGFPVKDNGIRFTTTIDTFGGYDEPLKVLQANFKEVGIELKINTLDDPGYDEKVWFGHKFELTILGGYQGPDISAMSQRFVTGGGINLGEYSNPELDKLFKQGTVVSDEAKRAEIYKGVQKILSEDLPCSFLAEKGAEIPTKAYVKGHPRSPEFVDKCAGYEFSHVWLDKEAK
ncbi:peptide/nickel transport system substrate-binding protein [Hathewaya proteolytica DSM 3090]|uniref:Peptide/nickel transport system substrate-binding protein n=1 Tax=Hathewaya proteolytica DSM 3090 TaxID=1121331 RepID=A0A1M6PKE0_9CLOT|nr:ABC transporter substrate-binding protein [Hathewaya proteolytica]SHK08374.1 peptide/nickel transport system substrate-binding protein [Hathewaya proteolytica DSM 3090]